jgi:hypothetical protein
LDYRYYVSQGKGASAGTASFTDVSLVLVHEKLSLNKYFKSSVAVPCHFFAAPAPAQVKKLYAAPAPSFLQFIASRRIVEQYGENLKLEACDYRYRFQYCVNLPVINIKFGAGVIGAALHCQAWSRSRNTIPLQLHRKDAVPCGFDSATSFKKKIKLFIFLFFLPQNPDQNSVPQTQLNPD